MKKIFVVIAVAAGLAFSARPAFLQTERPDAQHEHGTRGGGMMQGGMMCPMMGMGGMGMMGESGGMMGGMGGMMGGRGGDPKMMAQMMQMRGEMMMKMGEVMMKHGKMMQQGQTKYKSSFSAIRFAVLLRRADVRASERRLLNGTGSYGSRVI